MAEATKGEGKQHVSIVICGHVDSGKSTTTGHLMFKLGNVGEREMAKLKKEADALGKSSFSFAFHMDTQKAERERGVTISCTTKEFFTDKYHYTVIDAPGHRDFIKNMITGAGQADIALLVVPADGNFTTAIQKGAHKLGQVQGQCRQHARLTKLLGVKQWAVGVNKMDCDLAKYGEPRFVEIRDEVKNMLSKIGYPPKQVEACIPIVPYSGFNGDNLTTPCPKLGKWWNGVEVTNPTNDKHKVKVVTILDVLNDFVLPPVRDLTKPFRVPILHVHKIKGVGDVLTGRVEQGILPALADVRFLPTHTTANPCTGRVFTVEMHHKQMPSASSGDNVGMNMKNLCKENMPKGGDVMVELKDMTCSGHTLFCCEVQVLDIPKKIKIGYSPIGYVKTAKAACKLERILRRKGKDTGKEFVYDNDEKITELKSNDIATVVFRTQEKITVEPAKCCEGLSRIALLESMSAIMLGKVTEVESAKWEAFAKNPKA